MSTSPHVPELPVVLLERLKVLKRAPVKSRFDVRVYEAADDRFIRRRNLDRLGAQPYVTNEYRQQRDLIWSARGLGKDDSGSWTRTKYQMLHNGAKNAFDAVGDPILNWAAFLRSFASKYNQFPD
jgi:hypothetical protein